MRTRQRRWSMTNAAFAICLVASFVGAPVAQATPRLVITPAAATGDVTVKVESFNILYGGDEVSWGVTGSHWCQDPAGCQQSLDRVVGAIRTGGADIVGMQEGTGNGCRIAAALGWYCNPRLQVLSRFPLIDPPVGNGTYVFAEIAPGRVMAVANVHLPSDPYGPYFPREGWTLAEVLALENELRMPAIQPQLAALPPLAAAGIPVVLTGDFNSPSHLDWTAAVSAVRPIEAPYPIDWPVAHALADAGFHDSYREVHPDPVANPGFTWTPGYPRQKKGLEVFDRIDWVLHAGPVTALASSVLGEAGYSGTDIAVDPWPSDHRSVVSTLRVTPAVPPSFAAPDLRRVFAGTPLSVRSFGSGAAGERVAVVPAGAGVGAAIASASTGGSTHAVLSLPTAAWTPGAYETVLVQGGAIVGGRSPFRVYPDGTAPSVWTNKATYAVGEPIVVSWRAAPGWKWDWVAVTKKGTGNVAQSADCTGGYCGAAGYLVWNYTSTAVEGSVTLDATAQVGKTAWPLDQGQYRVALYFDDGYAQLAASPAFRVLPGK